MRFFRKTFDYFFNTAHSWLAVYVAISLVVMSSGILYPAFFPGERAPDNLLKLEEAHAAVSLVQTTNNATNGSGGNTLTATFSATPAQNNLLVAVAGTVGTTQITGPAGWSTAINVSSTVSQAIFYKVAGAGESTNVTVTTAASQHIGLQIYEYSGLSASSPFDTASSTTGNSSSTNGAAITTAQAGELLLAASAINDGGTSFVSWSNSFTKENDFNNKTGSTGKRGTYSGADRVATSTGSFSSVGISNGTGNWIGQIAAFKVKATYAQADFRFFANTNGTAVGSPLAAQDAVATQASPGTPFRLRMLVGIGGTTIASGSATFSLQYVDRGAGTCASPTGFSPSSYTGVATSSGVIRYYDNSIPASGAALTSTSTDPTDGGNTIVNQTYQEQNTFTNSQGDIAAGQDGKWDFALVDAGAAGNETYCFRIVLNTSTVLTAYSQYPAITMGNVAPTISGVTLNQGNDIVLTEGTTTLIHATATASDGNGYQDLLTISGVAYRTSLGPSCAADNNNCYIATPADCGLGGCAGNTCTATCDFHIWYFAEPTDVSTTWSGDGWSAQITVADTSNSSTAATSSQVNLLSLLAFEASTSITYGSFNPGGAMSSLTASTTFKNTGNVSADGTLYGTDMTNGAKSIPVGDQRYATSVLAYASGTALLANPGAFLDLNVPKTTSSTNPATSTLFFGISIPTPQGSGNYTGDNTLIGSVNELPWP